MPSKEVYEKCLKAGYPVDKISYERYDSLLSQDDLELLFDLLSGFKDKNENHPVITANCVVANPAFEKIKKDNYQTYHNELITETFERYPKHAGNFNLWQQGLKRGLFFPQFHGREHLNVSFFMEALQKGNPDAIWGFENEMPGSIPKGPGARGNLYVEATMYNSVRDKEEKLKIILEGLDLFEELFGYRSKSIIPPNYTWSSDYNQAVFEKGVKYFQGNRKMREPVLGGKFEYYSHFLGQKNQFGQTYLVRNALFEPSLSPNIDSVDRCLSDIAMAFRMKKPAIISSHRINYVGFIDSRNRDKNLISLKKTISTAVKKWPDVEFLTTVELGRLISGVNGRI